MSRDQTGLRVVLREITQSAERSSLFRWMVENYAELTEASKGRRLQWRSLCSKFAELQLTDVTGKPATPETARKTWRRARQAVAEAQRRAAVAKPSRPGSVYPSRISPNWQPQEVPPPPPRQLPAPGVSLVPSPRPPPPSLTAPIAATDASSSAPESRSEVEAMVERAMAKLHQNDWYLFSPPPKRRNE